MSESNPFLPTLTRDQILNAQDRVVEALAIPEWSGSICVRSLTAGERENARQQTKDHPDTPAAAFFAVAAACDAQGTPLFQNQDAFRLTDKSAKAIERIADRALRLSSIGDEAREAAKNA
jgi:hypothetical protein